MNGCPGLYWHGKKACSKSVVASVSGFKLDLIYLLFCFQAVSALNRKSSKVKNIKIDSDGSDKVSVEFIDNEIKAVTPENVPKKVAKKNNPSLRRTAYLPIHQRVKPVFWSGRHYLQIAEFGIPR